MADAMDSKSISRKGVGVQLPSLAPVHPASSDPASDRPTSDRAAELRLVAREVAPVLWASLSARLRAARLELAETLRALRRDRGSALRDERRVARQEELRESVRRAGWCLGLLGSAQGVDLLRARREPEGLRWLVAALAEARGIELTPPAAELPRLASTAPSAFELPLLVAWCLLRAGDSSGGAVRWSLHRTPEPGDDVPGADPAHARWRLEFELGTKHEQAEVAARCARLDSACSPEPRLSLGPARLELSWRASRA